MGGIINILYTALTFLFFRPTDCYSNAFCDFTFRMLNVHNFMLSWLTQSRAFFLIFLSSLVTGFVIGAIIGWIVEKVKGRKEVISQ